MNKIEKAIEHFRYGITHDIFSEPVTTYAKLAVDALREQAERSEGCEYCKDMKYMPFAEHEVYIDGNGKLDVDSDEDFQLNFCPMCGKRLEVEP